MPCPLICFIPIAFHNFIQIYRIVSAIVRSEGWEGGLWLCCTDPWDWNEIVHQLQVHMTHWIGHFLKTLLHSWISSVWFIWYRHLAISLVPHTKKKQSQLHKWAMRCNKLNVFILFVSHEISHLICRYGEQRKWNER